MEILIKIRNQLEISIDDDTDPYIKLRLNKAIANIDKAIAKSRMNEEEEVENQYRQYLDYYYSQVM